MSLYHYTIITILQIIVLFFAIYYNVKIFHAVNKQQLFYYYLDCAITVFFVNPIIYIVLLILNSIKS